MENISLTSYEKVIGNLTVAKINLNIQNESVLNKIAKISVIKNPNVHPLVLKNALLQLKLSKNTQIVENVFFRKSKLRGVAR